MSSYGYGNYGDGIYGGEEVDEVCPQIYCDRDILKSALSMPATSTGAHRLLDRVLKNVSRKIDRECGFQFYPSSGVRYFRPQHSTHLELDYPLLAVDSLTLDTNGNGSYESTLDSTAYYLTPDNATGESPPQPYWGIELRSDAAASAAFPVSVARGAKVTGKWGYYDEREETSAKPATAINPTLTVWDMTGASELHPGQTIRVDDEQVFIVSNALSGSATAASSGQIKVKRAQNGTTGATHSSLSTMSIYTYPIIEEACLSQAEMDYRAQAAPLGTAGGELGGGESLRSAGGLHPFVRNSLDQFRTRIAR